MITSFIGSAIAVVGNKVDLIEREEIKYEDAKAYAKVISSIDYLIDCILNIGHFSIEFKCYILIYQCKRKLKH